MPTKKWAIEVKEEQLQAVPTNTKDGRVPKLGSRVISVSVGVELKLGLLVCKYNPKICDCFPEFRGGLLSSCGKIEDRQDLDHCFKTTFYFVKISFTTANSRNSTMVIRLAPKQTPNVPPRLAATG
ncbi:hypothetical protein EB796_008307 [Bugula neritina]|uniref:Uncharacterized protein n=1 Tax=Bugula neritina TaxID=10212 RepID=A0A7J7K5E0_BUGNE|nr:hypothetical protein EB796_008307 [Bugula neritina]